MRLPATVQRQNSRHRASPAPSYNRPFADKTTFNRAQRQFNDSKPFSRRPLAARRAMLCGFSCCHEPHDRWPVASIIVDGSPACKTVSSRRLLDSNQPPIFFGQ